MLSQKPPAAYIASKSMLTQAQPERPMKPELIHPGVMKYFHEIGVVK